MKTNIRRIMISFALSLMLTTSWMTYDTHAMSQLHRLHCDYVFSSYATTQIDRKDYPRCEKRFDYLTKMYFTNNYR